MPDASRSHWERSLQPWLLLRWLQLPTLLLRAVLSLTSVIPQLALPTPAGLSERILTLKNPQDVSSQTWAVAVPFLLLISGSAWKPQPSRLCLAWPAMPGSVHVNAPGLLAAALSSALQKS